MLVIFSIIFTCASAAPALLYDTHLPIKSTITKSNQIVDHGSLVPAYSQLPTHALYHDSTHMLVHSPLIAHSTPFLAHSSPVLTHSSSVLTHASPVLTHTTPVLAYTSPVLTHTSPVFAHTSHVLTHSAPVLVHTKTVKTGDSAVSHQSSTVHETVPEVNSLLYAVHH